MSLSNIPDVANANGQQEDPSFPLYTEGKINTKLANFYILTFNFVYNLAKIRE